jgi:hypothetical protein
MYDNISQNSYRKIIKFFYLHFNKFLIFILNINFIISFLFLDSNNKITR